MGDFTEASQTLSPAKRALLELRLKQQEAKAAEGIKRRTDRGRAPLSYAQQRLWFLQQLDPDNPAYHVYAAVKMVGRLDVAALERSLSEMVRRHEALRTRFVMEGEEPVQVISPEWRVEVPVVDLRGWGAAERERETVRLAVEEARRPFDLAAGPVFRARRLELGEEENVLLVTMHHVVSDGWSVGVLVREFATLYEAYAAGKESPLKELGIQYGDFAAWQRETLVGERLEEQLGYWRKQLGGELPVLELPLDHARPAVRTYRGGQYRFEVGKETTERLKEWGRKQGATLFMTLLAAFDVLLARYSGQEDIVVGTPIANRRRMETEELIGFFVNTLVMRVDVSGNPTLEELLERVKRVAVEAYGHQDVPFEKLVEEIQPKRDLSGSALFQVMFVLQNMPRTQIETVAGLKLESIEYDREVAKFDLSWTAWETESGLTGIVEYNADLFERETVERMAGHWVRVLEQVGTGAEKRVWELELMSAAERRQVVEEWNHTTAEFPREKTIVDLIEEQVSKFPDHCALSFEDKRLTYAELNGRAAQLARWLCTQNIGPESLVGVYAHRSMEMVIALLGILKAGAAYVPFDPDAPKGRLSAILDDTQVPVVLTQDGLRSEFPSSAAKVLALDTEWSTVESVANVGLTPRRASPDNAAYVIFTSGSTGQPKGVINTHRGLCNRLWWMQQTYRIGADDVVLQKTPYTFDVSVWEFFWPLMAGATLVVSRPHGHRDGWYLSEVIAEHKVTTLHFVPSMLASFLDRPDLTQCHSVRRVICSGEELTLQTQNRFFERMPWAELHNLYGPTEASIDVTSWQCRPDSAARTVPIGYPISNAKIHILDAHKNPVPIGAEGELHIGGVGLARGYLNRPELTNEKFIANPFAAGERLYCTGDRARYRHDGAIEYRGRYDFQLKLRGSRVEPGEIEFHLRQHPAVGDTVVVARNDGRSGIQLVAYVVLREGVLDPSALRSWLKERVPDVMVPASFVALPELPLNGNGKIDRKSLPEPEAKRHTEHTYVEARTDLERTVVGIWGKVLHHEKISVTDDFFALGGHSLMVTQVVARLREELNLEVPVAAMFKAPTAEEFAAVVASIQASTTAKASVPRLRPSSRAQAARRSAGLGGPTAGVAGRDGVIGPGGANE